MALLSFSKSLEFNLHCFVTKREKVLCILTCKMTNVEFKGISHTTHNNGNSVSIFSPSCCSKLWLSFFFFCGAQMYFKERVSFEKLSCSKTTLHPADIHFMDIWVNKWWFFCIWLCDMVVKWFDFCVLQHLDGRTCTVAHLRRPRLAYQHPPLLGTSNQLTKHY